MGGDAHNLEAARRRRLTIAFSANFLITSSEGVQQEDPLGTLLFSLTLADVLNECVSEFVVAYLDDVTMGDSVDRLLLR